MYRLRDPKGFTIVELLIVVVVIGILAAISVVAFSTVQQRSRDSKRVADMNSIVKVLEVYKHQVGRYPLISHSGLGAQGGWESSAREAPGQFLHELRSYGMANGTPVDPVNNAIEDTIPLARAAGKYTYAYYRYSAGSSGCDSSRGSFYILGFIESESQATSIHSDSPGFSCSGRNWQSDFDWVTGAYEN